MKRWGTMSLKWNCKKHPRWAVCSVVLRCRLEEPQRMNQSTSTVFMVRPHSFRKNEETATNNHYQRDLAQASPEEIVQRAQDEFDGLATVLEAAGVR